MLFPTAMISKEAFKKYIFISSVIFLVAFFSGYFTFMRFPIQSRQTVEDFLGSVDFVADMGDFLIFLFIFLNNAIKAFFVILLGFFFCLVPIFFIYTNGELIGLVLGVLIDKEGFWKVFASIFPHGILEIPIMILTASYGIWLGICFYERIFHKKPFLPNLYFALHRYFKTILPIIFIASVIETFVTPFVLNLFFP